MKTPNPQLRARSAFTLLEMTIVIMVMVAMISTGLFVSKKMDEWKVGREAAETLRSVYSAQRLFLADNPTRLVSSIAAADIVPYLQNGATNIPTVKSLTGTNLTLIINVSPPVINAGSGVIYDPSGSNKDSIWDVGE